MESTYMDLAVSAALKSIQKGGGPFGAVIVDKDGNLLSCNHNQVVPENDPTAHAEIVCIREACKQLNTYSLEGCVLYTTCEPCSMCTSAILWARMSKVYYGNTREDAHAIGFDDREFFEEVRKSPEKRRIPMEQCCRDMTIETFEAWQEKTDKTHY
jgi:guanine deaminase